LSPGFILPRDPGCLSQSLSLAKKYLHERQRQLNEASPLQAQGRGIRGGFLWQSIDFGVKYRSSTLATSECTWDMPNRNKILILLFTATLTVGALTLWHSSNDNDAVEQFRSLFSSSTLYNLKHSVTEYSLPSINDRASLWYGGISLFSVIVILLVLKAARRSDSRRSKERLR
jgi:hypothetical protein